jgi:hypothetical protein
MRRPEPSVPTPLTRSFEDWDVVEGSVVQVCHPRWHGVRSSTLAFGAPVIEAEDFAPHAEGLAGALADHGAHTLVVQAWPPGAGALLRAAHARGLATRVISHSSMAQHGTDAGEAEAVSEALSLADEGVVGGVGFVKDGLAEAFSAMGHPAVYVPNRSPLLPDVAPVDLGDGLHVGILLDPYWRKNVTTQIGAAAILGATAHVIAVPDVPYLYGVDVIEHGVLPWGSYLGLQAGMDVNLNATLSECHPMAPMESYASGVPSLVSATSILFRDDRELRAMTTVAEADNPRDVAGHAARLIENRDWAVRRARSWMEAHDAVAAERFAAFVAEGAAGARTLEGP